MKLWKVEIDERGSEDIYIVQAENEQSALEAVRPNPKWFYYERYHVWKVSYYVGPSAYVEEIDPTKGPIEIVSIDRE